MRRLLLTALLVLLTAGSASLRAQSGSPPGGSPSGGPPPAPLAPEQDLKAAYLYHFVQFTQWPGTASDAAPVHICLDAAEPLAPALRTLADGAAGSGRPIVIDTSGTIACQVWINGRQPLPADLATQPVLTVSVDAAALAPHVIIALHLRDGRVTFSINHTLARQRGLTISSKLLRLAEVVQ